MKQTILLTSSDFMVSAYIWILVNKNIFTITSQTITSHLSPSLVIQLSLTEGEMDLVFEIPDLYPFLIVFHWANN